MGLRRSFLLVGSYGSSNWKWRYIWELNEEFLDVLKCERWNKKKWVSHCNLMHKGKIVRFSSLTNHVSLFTVHAASTKRGSRIYNRFIWFKNASYQNEKILMNRIIDGTFRTVLRKPDMAPYRETLWM